MSSYIPPHRRKQLLEASNQKAEAPTQPTHDGNRDNGYPAEKQNGNGHHEERQQGRWQEDRQQGNDNRGDRGYYDRDRGGYQDRDRGYDNRGYGDRDGYDRGYGGQRSGGRFNGFHNRDRQMGGRWNDQPQDDRLEEELFKNAITTGINFDKYEDIPVDVMGSNIPASVDSFDESGLHSKLMKNIERAHYKKPTPVQKYSIPIGIAKRDLMACAQTGSGKTGGFLFPIIHTLLANGVGEDEPRRYRGGYNPSGRAVSPQALILSPTRELTTQIYEEARKFTYQIGLRSVVVYGGTVVSEQTRDLQRGCNILVATPGRLLDLIQRGYVSLDKVQFFVLDEADNMLDMGFEPQIRQIVERENLPPKEERQTMMYSATFPKEIQQLAKSFLNDYIFLTVGRVGSTTDLITQIVEYVEDQDKLDALLHFIEKRKEGLTLVFIKTKKDCDIVEYELKQMGLSCESIHGDRTQQERERALRRFKDGQSTVLIATDVASRGLNIPNVTHVVNFDMPENIDSYIHRIGRTGRAGNEGLATSFYNQSNNMVISDLIEVLEETNQVIPDWMKQEKALYERQKNLKKKSSKGGYSKFGSGNSRFGSKMPGRWGNGGTSNYSGGFGGEGFGGRSQWGGSNF